MSSFAGRRGDSVTNNPLKHSPSKVEPCWEYSSKMPEMLSSSTANGFLLAWESAFRTHDWSRAFPNPEVAMRQIRGLLALV